MIKAKDFLFLASCFLFLVLSSGCSTNRAIRTGDYWGNQAAVQQFQRAEKYYYDGKYNEAIAEYQYYIDQFGDIYYGDEAQKKISESFVRMNQWNEAAESYEELTNKFPKSQYASWALDESAKIYEQISNFREAVRIYQRIIEEYYTMPQRPDAVKKIKEILLTKYSENRWAKKKIEEIDKIIIKKQTE
ncbi:MAG: tetratricopeptide repeat protein [Elusimicrobia bacterium]|nr:tetratricopeptide repeat protein [Elusimicrobiota bacterium]